HSCTHWPTVLLDATQLRGVAEPAARIGFGGGGGIGDAAMRDIREARIAKQSCPFRGAQQVSGSLKLPGPLMAVRIFTIVVDQDPRRAAFAQHAENLPQTARRVRPIVSRLNRNRPREEI